MKRKHPQVKYIPSYLASYNNPSVKPETQSDTAKRTITEATTSTSFVVPKQDDPDAESYANPPPLRPLVDIGSGLLSGFSTHTARYVSQITTLILMIPPHSRLTRHMGIERKNQNSGLCTAKHTFTLLYVALDTNVLLSA